MRSPLRRSGRVPRVDNTNPTNIRLVEQQPSGPSAEELAQDGQQREEQERLDRACQQTGQPIPLSTDSGATVSPE
jgi:hypothetical protein